MHLNFPLDLRFKLIALASQIAVRDATGRVVLYVKQKAFKLKEAVTIFGDQGQTTPLYRIKADRALDISAHYEIADQGGMPLGVVQRRGMRSLWRANYEIHRGGTLLFKIHEENPWIKVFDSLLSEIPLIGMFTGHFLHPAYVVTEAGSGTAILRAVKKPAFFEGRFQIDRLGATADGAEPLAVLSMLMMLLLERRRG